MSKKDNLAKKPLKEAEVDFENKVLPLDSQQEEHREGVAALKTLQAKKFQQMSQRGAEASPLQVNLMQFESLRVAQEKIVDLEKEVEELRSANENLASSGDFLKDKVNTLKAKLEDGENYLKDEKGNFEEEKQVLLVTLSDLKKEVSRLKENKKELENRLSKDLQNIRVRENSLENRLEILKLEGTVLQREKNNKIIDLQKKLNQLNENLKSSYKKNQELQNNITQLKENVRKTVSVLRTVMHNLEGIKEFSDTQTGSTENN